MKQNALVLDLGTGSGCIGIALAHYLPWLQVIAVDISDAAICIARKNADMHNVSNRIQFICGDISETNFDRKADVIVSNPPYIPTQFIDNLQSEVRLFEPRTALDGGPHGGFACIEQVFGCIRRNTMKDSYAIIEFGEGQADDIQVVADRYGMTNISIHNDLSKMQRVLTCHQL